MSEFKGHSNVRKMEYLFKRPTEASCHLQASAVGGDKMGYLKGPEGKNRHETGNETDDDACRCVRKTKPYPGEDICEAIEERGGDRK